MLKNINNSDVSACVGNRVAFITKNKTMFGNWNEEGTRYAVWSYGPHFPMYVWDAALVRWFGNSGRLSRTTSRHQRCARPTYVDQWLDTKRLQAVFTFGFAGHIAERLAA